MRAETSSIFPRPCRALIFDLDGVLTDTAETHYRAWERLAQEISVPFDRRINARLKGVDRMASLEIILERAGRAYHDREKQLLAERKNGYYRDAIAWATPDDVFPGVLDLLEDARSLGLRLGLASASRNAAALLERLGIADRFDCIADAALVQRPKPDPEIFLAAAAGLKVDPALCIGIEDAAAGVRAIHAAGMAAIGIGDAVELGAADAVLPTIADLRLSRFVVPVRSEDDDAPPHQS